LASRQVDFVDSDIFYGPFRQGMRELGYIEGKNLVIEWRSAEGNNERLPGLATELMHLKVDVIVAASTPATSAAQKATATIPIVMGSVGDPVRSGFVKSLARPAGNITGLSNLSDGYALKQLDMLMSMVPKLSRLVLLLNPSNSSNIKNLERVQAAAQTRGLKVIRVDARTPQEIGNAFTLIRQQNADALIVLPESLFLQQKNQIAELTRKLRLPAMANERMLSEAGVLMSYGPSLADSYLRAATYVDKILKGAKPADLPVEQPTKFELVINGKTARALHLTIPQTLLVSADKVIE